MNLSHGPANLPLQPPGKGRARRKPAAAAERLGDAQALVPLGRALGAGDRADLELRHAPADRQVDDRRILALARAGRDDRAEARAPRRVQGRAGLAQGARLVGLQEHGVAGAAFGRGRDARRVGHQEIVADHLDARAGGAREFDPALGIVLGQRVLNGDDGIAPDPVEQERAQRVAVQIPSLVRQGIASVSPELGGRDIERDRHVLARSQAGALNRPNEQREPFLVALKGGPVAALVGDPVAPARFGEKLAGGAIDLGRPVERLDVVLGADCNRHVVLDVDPASGMGAAAEDLDLG